MPQSPARSSAKEDHPDVRQKMIANAGLPWRTEEAFDDEGESAGVVEIRDVNDVIVADVYWAQRAALIVEAVNRLGSGQPAADAGGDVKVFQFRH